MRGAPEVGDVVLEDPPLDGREPRQNGSAPAAAGPPLFLGDDGPPERGIVAATVRPRARAEDPARSRKTSREEKEEEEEEEFSLFFAAADCRHLPSKCPKKAGAKYSAICLWLSEQVNSTEAANRRSVAAAAAASGREPQADAVELEVAVVDEQQSGLEQHDRRRPQQESFPLFFFFFFFFFFSSSFPSLSPPSSFFSANANSAASAQGSQTSASEASTAARIARFDPGLS